jgi:hypothetical protein
MLTICRHRLNRPELGLGACSYCQSFEPVDRVTHKFLASKSKITCDFSESKFNETEHKNGLEIIPHILRMGGLRKKAVLENRDVKESPLYITSGLLSHGGNNS